MKLFFFYLWLSIALLHSEPLVNQQEALKQHAENAEQLAYEQDELSADVQQLIIEQTVPQVIELLTEVDDTMKETTEYLLEKDTGGVTLAAQTEIIEKIHAAAKARQKQQGSGKSGGAMMDMLERMMGKKDQDGEPKQGKQKGQGEKAGKGQTGESDLSNTTNTGDADGKVEQRTVPKAAGTAGKGLPNEFQAALDAYNRGLEKKSK